MSKFCDSTTKKYELTASAKSDGELMQHLFTYYPTLSKADWKSPMHRKWRRCVIVELLRRGLITKDPGHGEPERR